VLPESPRRSARLLSSRNPRVQRLRRLARQPRARRDEGVLVIEGPRAVAAALDHGAPLHQLFVGPGAPDDLRTRAERAGVEVAEVADGVLEKVLTARTPQAVAAVAAWPEVDPATVADRARALGAPLVALAGVGDPGNAGTVIRSAAAAGAAGVLLTAGSVDPANPKCVRASAGALFALPVATVDGLGGLDLRTVGARAGGAPPDEVDLSGTFALVLGGEAAGLPEGLATDAEVALPLEAGVESLNVAMAATVLLYEARRQRRGGAW
jgi:RNA methyltransferase, TrmH family